MRRLPLATLALAALTLVAYAAELVTGGLPACERFGFTAAHPSLGTALSSMLLHDPDHVAHLLGNVVALVIFGTVVEQELGGGRLAVLLVAGGLGGSLTHLVVAPGSDVPLVGLSGGLCALMAVGAVARPRVMLGFVGSYIAMNLLALAGVAGLMPATTSVADHVGGFIVGASYVFARAARLGSRRVLA